MEGTKNKPLTNSQKEEILLEKYYRDNFEKNQIGKVNLDKNEVIMNMKGATIGNYNDALIDKKVSTVSEANICLENGQKALKLVAYCSTNYFDLDNPQKGRLHGRYVEALKQDIRTDNPKIKTIVVFGGDLLGSEWTLTNLKNATITKDGVALYWGLNKRKERLKADIKVALNLDADVYLIKGAQEHKIYKETGRDIFKEVADELGSEHVKYIDEGTTVICNLIAKNGKTTYNTLAFQTNMLGKSQDSNGDYRAGVSSNGKVNADAVFVFNGNASGKFDKNIYHVSGQSMFKRTAKGKRPEYNAKHYNVFTIYPEDSHDLTIVEGSPENLYSENLALEMKVFEAKKTKKTLAQIAKEKFDSMIENLVED